MKVINIAKEFTKFPAGRHVTDGQYSGETFREKFLVPALQANETVQVVLDGTTGYGSSFIDEAFGGLIRHKYFTKEELKKKLELIAREKDFQQYKGEIWNNIEESTPGDI